MTILPYPLDETDSLVTHLSDTFPEYAVNKRFGNIQVRTSGFTLTGNVAIKPNKRQQHLKLSTNYDMRMLYWFLNWPIAIYVTTKKDKQLAMEQEVAIAITEFTTTINN